MVFTYHSHLVQEDWTYFQYVIYLQGFNFATIKDTINTVSPKHTRKYSEIALILRSEALV